MFMGSTHHTATERQGDPLAHLQLEAGGPAKAIGTQLEVNFVGRLETFLLVVAKLTTIPHTSCAFFDERTLAIMNDDEVFVVVTVDDCEMFHVRISGGCFRRATIKGGRSGWISGKEATEKGFVK